MKEQIYKICTQLNDGQIAVTQATEQLLDLFVVMPRFIITYKNEDFDKELFWETIAKSDVDAVDMFWKTHDVLCELVSIKEV